MSLIFEIFEKIAVFRKFNILPTQHWDLKQAENNVDMVFNICVPYLSHLSSLITDGEVGEATDSMKVVS